jgi:2-oxoglutarate ferredoxin oxidoreductase subunit delta
MTRTSKKHRFLIDEAACKGCGICIEMCPKSVLAKSETRNAKGYLVPLAERPGECAGCRTCEKICPDLAVWIEEEAR